MPDVVLWEAVALSLDIDPDYLQARNNKIDRHRQAIQYDDEKEFNDKFKIAERNEGKNKALRPTEFIPGTHRIGISLAEFAAWALSINWEIPMELANIASESSESNIQNQGENRTEPDDSKPQASDVSEQEEGAVDRVTNSQTSANQSTAKGESECQKWLKGLMANGSVPQNNKQYYFQEAIKKYEISKRGFDRAWANAITNTNNHNWDKSGRKKTKPC